MQFIRKLLWISVLCMHCWFDKMKTIHKSKPNSKHCRMFWMAWRDYEHLSSRENLMTRFKRAIPIQWVIFLTSSKVIKIAWNKEPPNLYSQFTSAFFTEQYKPDIGYLFENSKRNPGNKFLTTALFLENKYGHFTCKSTWTRYARALHVTKGCLIWRRKLGFHLLLVRHPGETPLLLFMTGIQTNAYHQ